MTVMGLLEIMTGLTLIGIGTILTKLEKGD